jgi:GR25 family glycosyltransferase involved in LPS biosynthesis
MIRLLLCCLLAIHSFAWTRSSINDYLDDPLHYVKPQASYIDAAFVIKLHPNDNIEKLKADFAKHNIPLIEYNQFENLSQDLMDKFCSSVISPYLLTQYLSHLSIYKYCIKNNLNKVLIIENHAEVVGDLKDLEKIVTKVSQIADSWDIIYTDIDWHDSNTGNPIIPVLAHIPQNREKIDNDISKIRIRYGTASFVISKTGMKKILKYFSYKHPKLPYDQILFKIPTLKIYGSNFDIITNRYTTKEAHSDTSVIKDRLPSYETGTDFWLNPIELLTYDRFDVASKYIYAKYYINKYQTDWHIQLYKSHLEKWIKFYNTEPLKIGFKDFQTSFNNLLNSLYSKKFDENNPIPINNLGLACNGAHRIGSCLALGIPVKVKVEEGQSSPSMTAAAFKKLYQLEEKYLDHMAYEYAKLKKNTFIVSLFPFGHEYKKEAEAILNKYGIIVYDKDIWLSDTGALEFIRLVYTGEWWVGSYSDNFKHSRAKAKLCFPTDLNNKCPVKIYLYECKDAKAARKAKEEIRALCNKGNEVVHINDTHEQTKIIAATVFNRNSIEFLNKRQLKKLDNFERLFANLKKFIAENNVDPETLCVDTSAVLSSYGLRDCSDMDIIHHDPLPASFSNYGVDDHNPHLHHHSKPLDEILFNPENHFYYQGVKFASLELVKKMKLDRGSEKDLRDAKLIDQLQ